MPPGFGALFPDALQSYRMEKGITNERRTKFRSLSTENERNEWNEPE